MSPIRATENARFTNELNQLNQFSQFLSEIAAVVVAGNDEFENIWNIANRVYDRHCRKTGPSTALAAPRSGRDDSSGGRSAESQSGRNYSGQNYPSRVSVISRSGTDRSQGAALSA
jgi:hypothetical protein